MFRLYIFLTCLGVVGLFAMCTERHSDTAKSQGHVLKTDGKILKDRIQAPANCSRTEADSLSFAAYLRRLPLKPEGSEVLYYNGESKGSKEVYCAVVDLPIGNKNLQQCADAVIRLRAEYLFSRKRFNDISFHFTSGFVCDYASWRKGYRVSVKGNKVNWVQGRAADTSYKSFWAYLETVFSYAGTQSLPSDMKPISLAEVKPGDVLLSPGSPGHAVIIADMAKDTISGKKYFLLAQSYMPAQDIQILKHAGGPWFSIDNPDMMDTPEWLFNPLKIYRFKE